MSKASEAANAVVYSVEKVLDLYGVDYTREQSRCVMVQDDRRSCGFRPLYFGEWKDAAGNLHRKGKSDLLARPRVPLVMWTPYSDFATLPDAPLITVPLWIECKSGKGRMESDQIAFKNWVESNGDAFLLIHDDVRPLIAWLDSNSVKKQPKKIIHAAPMDSAQVEQLPCRHCGDEKPDHIGTIFACKKKLGKVYSPNLKVKT